MSRQSDFHAAVYSTARALGANDVQARLAAAQASEETGFGQSMVGNNAFGVKAGPNYAGDTVTASTQEDYGNGMVRENANFRAYDGLEASVKDYLGVVQQNFPDAWNAPTFSEAVQGLNSGVYGKYATNRDYASHIKSIDNKLGATSYAANPANVPTPYGPNDVAPIGGVASLNPVSQADFRPVDPATAFAANPENVPVPSFSTDLPNGLLSTYGAAPTEAANPFNAALGPVPVTPALGPVVEGWSAMAAAKPMTAPMDSVTANGLLGAAPGLAASATANVAPQVAAIDTSGFDMGRFGVQPVSLPDTSNFDMSRFGPAVAPDTSNFDASRFDGAAPQTVSIDPGRFGPIDTSSFDVARFGTPSINPATNTQSFASPTPADLGSFPGAMAAQRTHMGQGIYSPQHQDLQANAEQQLQAITQTPSLQSSFVAPTGVTPAEQAIQSAVTPGLATPSMTPSQIAGYQQAAKTMAQAGMLNIGQQPPTDLSGNLPANFNVLSAPSLETVNVPNQPAISATPVEDQQTIQGPATTPAVTQQAVAQQAAAKQTPSLSSRLSNAINPGSAIGGILGGAALGPIGGIIGAMLGNSVYQGGGVTSPGSQPGGFLGYGMQNLAGAANGSAPAGSWGMASDGSRVTSQGNGWSTRTNAQGVTTSTSPWGGGAGYFGGDPNDPESYS